MVGSKKIKQQQKKLDDATMVGSKKIRHQEQKLDDEDHEESKLSKNSSK